MALDPRYILAYHFEQVFIDKVTGAPLNGEVRFFRDQSRLEEKDVYILSGTPLNYTYVNIGPTVTIANGVPTYNNNNVALYFLPYIVDDDENITNTVDLYYYAVFNSGGDPQFTREAQPNIVESDDGQIVDINYIPNGQFLLHNNLPETFTGTIYQAGEVRDTVTEIAPGGWTFERSNNTGTDLITFEQELPNLPQVDQSPRYVIHLITNTSGNARKDLCIKFNDVNKFASTDQQYTFGFSSKTATGTASVDLILRKFYGTPNGSSTTETVLTTFQVPSNYSNFSFSFTFGVNTSKSVGSNNDDYVQLLLRQTTDSNYNIFYSDFLLSIGEVQAPVFPPTPNNDFEFRSMGGMLQSSKSPNPPYPDFDGWDLYLPIRATKNGFIFDASEIGDAVFESQIDVATKYVNGLHISTNRVLWDGRRYETAGYSPLGIPFARLQQYYYDSTTNIPRYGTGPDYFMGFINASITNQLIIANTTSGAVTATADGLAPHQTGFTFETTATGSDYFTESYLISQSNLFFIEGLFGGAVSNPIDAGTSGFTVAVYQTGISGSSPPESLPQISSVITTAASALADPGNPGKYFTFDSIDGSAVNHEWYVWYQVTNETDPAVVGRTGIKIKLDAGGTESAAVVAQKTLQALNGWQVSSITMTAASTLQTGDYFTVNASGGDDFYIWYNIDNGGGDPNLANHIGIEVALTGEETAAQVATATQAAINSKYFAVPDARGKFIRAWDGSAGIDLDNRYSLYSEIIANSIGTDQLDANKLHSHSVTGGTNADQIVGGGGVLASGGDFNTVGGSISGTAGAVGRYDSRGINIAFNVAGKY